MHTLGSPPQSQPFPASPFRPHPRYWKLFCLQGTAKLGSFVDQVFIMRKPERREERGQWRGREDGILFSPWEGNAAAVYSLCMTTTKPINPSMTVLSHGCSESMMVTYPTHGMYATTLPMTSSLVK